MIDLPRRSKPVLDKRDLGQTNEQQSHFNEKLISELHVEVGSIQTSARICKQSIGARNRVGIGLPYRPARLELVPWNRLLDYLKVIKFRLNLKLLFILHQ
jgi:hypothetical protein